MNMPSGTSQYGSSYDSSDYDEEGGGAMTWTERCTDNISHSMEENPAGTLLSAFGVGLGIGAMIGLAVAMSTPRPKPRSRAEELGQRILDSMHDYLPDSISRRFG